MLGRLILWLVFGYLLYTVLKAARRAFHRPQHTPPPEKSRGGEMMERDPHCGTFVPRSDAVTARVHGEPHWFCSSQCRDEYFKNH
jgi:YHS domain-containing protein